MTLVSSGNQILLQGTSDTNPSTTTTSVVNNTSFTAAEDTLVYIQRSYEVPEGDDFQTNTEWYGSVLGYHRQTGGFMGGGFVYTAFNNIISALPIQTYGTRAGNATFSGEPGAMGNTTATYTDGGGTSRTIDAIIWGNPATNSADQSHWFLFALSGTSVPNNDNTFKSIVINPSASTTYTFNRSSANVYDTGENGRTVWLWDNQTSNVNAMTTSVVSSMHINGPDTTTTLNTGIAEEMGGADSSNVAFSDYYSDGTFHTTSGIPASGEIKFSDFYGKTKQSGIHSTAWVGEFFWNYVAFSGFWSNGGSMTDSTFTYPNTSTTATITTFYAINGGSNSIFLSVSGGAFSNSGWTNVKIWLNQSNDSGTPDYTFTRSSASHSTSGSGSSATTTWTWTGYSNVDFSGGTSIGDTQNNFMVID